MARTDTRGRIAEAAIAVLAEYGLDGFTASRLAEFAEVSKANLYHHFSSLDDIILVSFERLAMGLVEVAPPENMRFEDWLLAMGSRLIDLPAEASGAMRAYLVYFTRAMFDARLRAKMHEMIERSLAETVASLGDMAPRPIPQDEVQTMARLILIASDGFVVHAQMLGADRAALKRSWALFVQSIVPKGDEP